jgi:hypothetical protein
MDADVDEGAELRDVGDDPLEDHVGLHVSNLPDAFVERGCNELVAWVAARLAELFKDVGEGESGGGEPGSVDAIQKSRPGDDLVDWSIEGRGDLLYQGVTLWMDGSGVEWL